MEKENRNSEGYYDPTAYGGMKRVQKQEKVTDRRAENLHQVLEYIVKESGFRITDLQIRDCKSGRKYKW